MATLMTNRSKVLWSVVGWLVVFVFFFHLRPKPYVPAGAGTLLPEDRFPPEAGVPIDVRTRDAEEHVKQAQEQVRR